MFLAGFLFSSARGHCCESSQNFSSDFHISTSRNGPSSETIHAYVFSAHRCRNQLPKGFSLSFTRRELLRLGAYAGASMLTGRQQQMAMPASGTPSAKVPIAQAAAASPEPKGITLTPYVDPLPIPPVLRPSPGKTIPIRMRSFQQKIHRDLPPTTLWGYNDSWPGPTLEVRRGQPLSVKWSNELPLKHFLPIDPTIHGCEAGIPEVRAVTHIHGANVLPESDGYPDSWITPDGKFGPVPGHNPTLHPNDQPATTLWYHDHAIGITRLNVYAGLAGFYLIRDEEEDSFNLPSGPYEIPLMIQDRSFAADGTLLYPPPKNGTHPMWMQEFFGETICVNGKAAPYLEVEPRKYRFRLVNASNSRFYHLTLLPADENGKTSGRPVDAPPFRQIGTDGGLLPAPVTLHYLIISPGERFDLVIDFSEHKGMNLALLNDAPAPYARGGEIVPAEVMLFKVTKPPAGKDNSSLPDTLVPWTPLNSSNAVRERVLGLTEMDRPIDGYTMIGLLGQKHWDDPITEDPKAGSMEIWSFANATADVHPIHLHQVQFQVLNRQQFDAKTFASNGKLYPIGIPMAPESNERPAWKDTVKTYGRMITRVIAKFDLPPGTSAKPGDEFRYVWHCHVLEHEDNEMMRPYKIVV
jgi:spore coat protein A, manganese oxidase